MKTSRKVAIFDIDGTIFRSSLLIEVTEALIKEKIFPKNAREIYKKEFRQWTERKGSYEDYIMAVVKAYLKNIKGVKHKDFSKVAKKVIAENNNKVYIYTRDLVKELKKKNYYLLAISNSPQEMVWDFCKKLGFDKTYGRVYGLDKNDKYTGEVLYLDLISDKSKILKRAIEKQGLTLKGSIGVGDTEGDIPLMKIVEKPICFNPNKNLYDVAKQHGWEVVVERKDVVYEM